MRPLPAPEPLSAEQRFDPITGLVQPWFTHAALNEIQEWDLRQKIVLEWGGGRSSLWWADRARRVFTIETDRSWCNWIAEQAIVRDRDISIFHRPIDASPDDYSAIPLECVPNIVVIDGAKAVGMLKKGLNTAEAAHALPAPPQTSAHPYIDAGADSRHRRPLHQHCRHSRKTGLRLASLSDRVRFKWGLQVATCSLENGLQSARHDGTSKQKSFPITEGSHGAVHHCDP